HRGPRPLEREADRDRPLGGGSHGVVARLREPRRALRDVVLGLGWPRAGRRDAEQHDRRLRGARAAVTADYPPRVIQGPLGVEGASDDPRRVIRRSPERSASAAVLPFAVLALAAAVVPIIRAPLRVGVVLLADLAVARVPEAAAARGAEAGRE